MWRTAKIACIVGLFPLGLLIYAASQAQFTFQHPKAKDVKVVVMNGGAQLALNMAPPVEANPIVITAPKQFPRFATREQRHDFGFMDPHSRGTHSFAVRNEGQAPLKLRVSSTTCKCTVAGLSDNTIPPGGEGKVQLDWTVPANGRVFRQTATVLTNDPKNESAAFTIEGLIRTSLGADREEVSIMLDPDSSTTTDFTVFSQQWDDFSVLSLETSVAGVEWDEFPADESELAELKAKSGRTIRMTIPGNKATKATDTLRLQIAPCTSSEELVSVESGKPCQLEIPIHFSIRRRLSIYGPAIQSNGVIVLGETQQGVARQVRMQIKIRDKDASLSDVQFEATPSFLQAEITPHVDRKTGDIVAGLYDFVVRIPADAPACSYLGDTLAQVRLLTSHPRIPETPLGVRFAVLPR